MTEPIDLLWASAMPLELKAVWKLLETQSPGPKILDLKPEGNLRIFTIDGLKIATAVVGVGKVSCASSLGQILCRYDVRRAVIAGIAGALVDGPRIGDLAVITGAREGDWDLSRFGLARGQRKPNEDPILRPDPNVTALVRGALPKAARNRDAEILTTDRFLTPGLWKADPVLATLESDLCDMETAAFARVSGDFSVPWAGLRIVSDRLGEEGPGGIAPFLKKSSTRLAKICMRMIEQGMS